MSVPIPVLFLGDAPDLFGGLSRIGRDLALRLSSEPGFRVGFLGRGGCGDRRLPFIQYHYPAETGQWGEGYIQRVWENFADETPGVIFTIWDPTRLMWFARPYPEIGEQLHQWLSNPNFQRWGYFPVDGQGVGGKLGLVAQETLSQYDRVLAYSQWGHDLMLRGPVKELQWIPHGLNLHTFQPRDKAAARMAIGVEKDDLVIGCVMTNQPRKDWGTAMDIVRLLKEDGAPVKLWAQVDQLERSHAWSFYNLIGDMGLKDQVILGRLMGDELMSYHYSACDVTILPSLGEGFGYPIAESLACGVPCVHGNYAGGAELIDPKHLVEPIAWRMDGLHNQLRPVWNPQDWVIKIADAADNATDATPEECRARVEHLSWNKLWPVWRKWWRQGVRNERE